MYCFICTIPKMCYLPYLRRSWCNGLDAFASTGSDSLFLIVLAQSNLTWTSTLALARFPGTLSLHPLFWRSGSGRRTESWVSTQMMASPNYVTSTTTYQIGVSLFNKSSTCKSSGTIWVLCRSPLALHCLWSPLWGSKSRALKSVTF